jgi:hypothetical protein
MENVHFENVIKSFFLGLFLGIILQFSDAAGTLLSDRVVTVLASGSIGFLIGFFTEWLTSKLPISMANARMYFFVNNLIALAVATCIMVALFAVARSELEGTESFVPVLAIVLGIICIANLFDYFMYRRAQTKLRNFKAMIKDQ